MTIHIAIEIILVVAVIAGWIYNEKTGGITELEQAIWEEICRKINRAIRNYERRKAARW